jgi:hypothetical protein
LLFACVACSRLIDCKRFHDRINTAFCGIPAGTAKQGVFEIMPIQRCVTLVVFSLALCAQTSPGGAGDPETPGKVFFLDSSQSLKELPVETWTKETRLSKKEGMQSICVVQRTRSPFRISSSDKIVFVYRRPLTAEGQEERVQTIQLYAFEVGPKQRSGVIRPGHGIPITVSQFGTYSNAISPQGFSLAHGEYWLSIPGEAGHPIPTFGVD